MLSDTQERRDRVRGGGLDRGGSLFLGFGARCRDDVLVEDDLTLALGEALAAGRGRSEASISRTRSRDDGA